jgi:hypothetical protein
MGSPAFPTSNNAPLPIPGGWGNPTGANTGNMGSGATAFPVSPYGGPSYNAPIFGGGNMAGLTSGLNSSNTSWNQNLFNEMGRAYGKGTGQLLGDVFANGLFNPQVAAAMLNAQAPGIARGEAGIQGAFADAGARFSSASALGMGDFESQVQLNQQQTLAQMFEQAQGEQLSLLQSVLPTLNKEQANHGGGLLDDIVGGLETIGGFAAAPFTGGASLSLASGGLSTLMQGLGGGGNPQASGISPGGGGSGSNIFSGLTSLFSPPTPNLSGVSMGGDATGNMSAIQQIIANMQASGAGGFGGAPIMLPGQSSGGPMSESLGFPY